MPRRDGGRARARTGVAVLIVFALATTYLAAPATVATTPAPRTVDPSSAGPQLVGNYGSTGTNWTMFMGNVEHDSYQNESPSLEASTAGNLSLQWTYQSGGVIVTEPIVANDRVYFGAWDGSEYSLWASNGSRIWKTFTGQSSCTLTARHLVGVTSTATLTGSDLYFGGGKDYWEALAPTNGSLLWQVYTGNSNGTKGDGYYNWASPLIYDGYAYIGLSSHCDNPLVQGQLLKVSLATHHVVGVFNTTPLSILGATIWSSPAVDPSTGTIYFATGNLYACCGTNQSLDDSIVAVNASTMTLVDHFQVPYWERIQDGDFGASVTLFSTDNGTPMVGDDNKDGLYFALNESRLSAGPLWTDNISLIPGESSAAFAKGSLIVGSARTTVPSGGVVQGAVRSLNATTGAVNWERSMNGNVYGPPVIADDVVVAAGGTELAVLNAASGKVLFRYNASADFYGGPSVAGGRIYIGDVYGRMYCFGFPLAAQATLNTTSGPAPLHVAYHGAGFGGEAGYNYSWNFGDGKHAAIEDPRHVYTAAGTYAVVLRVTDLSGASATSTVLVVVGEPLVQSVPVGTDPSFACYDKGNGYEYVADQGSSNVSVLAHTTVIATIPVGASPASMVYDRGNGFVYVANAGSNNVTVINGTAIAGTVTLTSAPGPMALDGVNGYVYVPTGNTVSLINGTALLGQFPVGNGPGWAIYDRVDDRVYVANSGSDNVSVIHGASVLTSVSVGVGPGPMSVDGANGVVYVANAGSDNLSEIQGNALAGTIALPSAPVQSTFDPLDGDVYVSLSGSAVSVVNGSNVEATVAVGSTPGASAYDGADGFVYVPTAGTANVSVLDGTKVLRSIPVGNGPGFANFAAGSGYIYVLNALSGNVSAILTYHEFPVTFVESGLPIHTNWSVTVAGTLNATETASVGFQASNGSFSYSVNPVPEYEANDSGGLLVVNGSARVIQIGFALAVYNVTFTERGLPVGLNWSVTFNGAIHAAIVAPGSSSNLTFVELNGTYAYTIPTPPYFDANITGGLLTVRGHNVTVSVGFTRYTPEYTVIVGEGGLPTGSSWSVDLGGSTENATVRSVPPGGTTVSFVDLVNGTYPYHVGGPSGFAPAPASGNVTVHGRWVNLTVGFLPLFALVFQEQSLPNGSDWSVDLNGSTVGATVSTGGGTSIEFFRTNGTYPYSVNAPAGYDVPAGTGPVIVAGTNQTVTLSFTPVPSPRTYTAVFVEVGLPGGRSWAVTLNDSTSAGVGSVHFSGLTNGTYGYSIPVPPGFTATPGSGTVTVDGANTSTTITFAPTHPTTPVGSTNTTGGARFLGLPALQGYALVALIVVVAALGATLLMLRRGRGGAPLRADATPPK